MIQQLYQSQGKFYQRIGLLLGFSLLCLFLFHLSSDFRQNFAEGSEMQCIFLQHEWVSGWFFLVGCILMRPSFITSSRRQHQPKNFRLPPASLHCGTFALFHFRILAERPQNQYPFCCYWFGSLFTRLDSFLHILPCMCIVLNVASDVDLNCNMWCEFQEWCRVLSRVTPGWGLAASLASA